MDTSRRKLLTAVGITGIVAGTLGSPTAVSAAEFGSRVLTVGLGSDGIFHRLVDAAIQAEAMRPTAASRVVIMLLPGTHVLTGDITLPAYTSLIGIDREACILSTSGNNYGRILYNKNCSLSNFTFIYASTASSGYALNAIDNVVEIGPNSAGTWLELDNLKLEFKRADLGAAVKLIGNRYVRFNNCEIATASTGVNCVSVHTVNFNSCDIWLLNIATPSGVDHVGVRLCNYGRLQFRTCKIATGYGPYEWPSSGGIVDSLNNIYGIHTTYSGGTTGKDGTRVELYNCWSIVRNEAAGSSSLDIINVFHEANGIVRIFGGYFQSEQNNSNTYGNRIFDLYTSDNGQIQLIGNAAITTTAGKEITGMSGTLVTSRELSSTTTLKTDAAMLYTMNTSAGGFTVYLPNPSSMGGRYIFKQKGGTPSSVTISGSGKKIDGNSAVILPAIAYARLEVQYSGSEWCIIG